MRAPYVRTFNEERELTAWFLLDLSPSLDFGSGARTKAAVAAEMRKMGVNLEYVDIGGGLGITYSEEKPPLPQDLSDAISPLVKNLGLTLVMEPGRVIVGNAGILVTKALYEKAGETKHFIIVDAAMTDLIRPALYGANHFAYPAALAPGVPAPERRMDFAPPGASGSESVRRPLTVARSAARG